MILLLDNYDSFVHNLARYFRQLGCHTRVIRSDQIDVAGCQHLAPEAVVISPGPRRPEQAGCSVPLVGQLAGQIPILGVCLGHQAIAVAFGGVVTRCGPRHGVASLVQHDGRGIFAGCRPQLRVGRYHSLAIDPAHLPAELEVTATSSDGVIMSVKHRTRAVYGLQFHPESVLTDDGLLMLQNFVALTRSPTTASPPPLQPAWSAGDHRT